MSDQIPDSGFYPQISQITQIRVRISESTPWCLGGENPNPESGFLDLGRGQD